MEDINDADYTYAKNKNNFCKIKKLGEYHQFYVQSETLLLPDESCSVFYCPRITMASSIKKDQSKIRSSN